MQGRQCFECGCQQVDALPASEGPREEYCSRACAHRALDAPEPAKVREIGQVDVSPMISEFGPIAFNGEAANPPDWPAGLMD
jgi:hypothetical protein